MKLSTLITTLLIGMASSSAYANIPQQTFNQKLHDMLPDDIKQSGKMISSVNGSFPPYTIVKGGNQFDGAAVDIDKALSQLLGIKIEHKNVSGLSSILMGIKSGRYTYDSGPVGDFANREESVDFVDYVQEFVVFAVKKGNPQHIDGIASTCGKRISVMAGGSAERVVRNQSKQCVKDGKSAIKVLSYTDQPTSILAVKSNRADAFFSSQAPLSYFVKMSNGELELAGEGKSNGFDTLYQGAVVPKGSPLVQVLKASYDELHKNGTYDAIMKKWNLEGNKLAAPGINLATAKASD
ncbi:transporter substrate-binding domain-containing protein [Vibrio sp. CAIM 722]|uniref:Transporter substrate-binding domain-containing protein n=1 Tax=Vibrio eleionomae TaxID=2653505 RepID=A0A7X4LH56_9VIBR|nr:ABC transporter substrate-binding protein [Vibrio eleionomae]MZI91858.1 transporter substrate-binding domain-containing protein [Vibrio eleionomae]